MKFLELAGLGFCLLLCLPQITASNAVSDIIDDCCCTKKDLHDANTRSLNALLNKLADQNFFSYFKVDLFSDCPFWVTESLCTLEGEGGCGICECDDSDPIVKYWKNAKTDRVVTMDESDLVQWNDFEKEMWFLPAKESEMSFVNLKMYTEGNTQYDGSLIWKRIYEENCFVHNREPDLCLEEKIFYKLISGLHTSINTHVCLNYRQEENSFIDNPSRLAEKILPFPDRIEHLYFTFLFLSRYLSVSI